MKNILLIFLLVFLFFPLIVITPPLEKPYPPRVIKYDPENPRAWAIEVGLIKEGDFIDNMIPCESSWIEWICNRDYGCRAGVGLCGIISGTWNKTIAEMSLDNIHMPEHCWQLVELPMSQERTEPIFDGECNLRVGVYIYQTKGTAPWGTEDSSWGSYRCWNNIYANNL